MTTPTKIWLSLIALSTFTFLVGWWHLTNNFFIVMLLLTTFIKGHLIAEYFMDLKKVVFKYRVLPTIWLILVIGLIGIAYYLPIDTK